MMNVYRRLGYPVVLLGLALLIGCSTSSKHMRLVPSSTTYRPQGHESLVIFMRPSSNDPQFQSSVFEVTSAEDKLVGIISAQKKVAYITAPGEHTFMSIGQGAEFLKARLDAGKTYYVLVTPVGATWKDQFPLTPVKSSELHTDKFRKWVEECASMENGPSAYEWARRNAHSIQRKKQVSLSKWELKPDAEKPALAPEDGM